MNLFAESHSIQLAYKYISSLWYGITVRGFLVQLYIPFAWLSEPVFAVM